MDFTQIKNIITGIFIAAAFLLSTISPARALPTGFQDELVLAGLNLPVNLTTLPDGRMLVLLKAGEIRIFDPQTSPVVSANYLTITNIESGEERGLTSLVLDPDFLSNGYFYVYYTHASSARNRISRFTHTGNSASLASEVLIWQDNEDWSDSFHYGGGMDFGPDGRLYLATGEEFDGPQAQDLTRAGGKIIRINKDGTIPADNPFIDGPGGNLDEIWAYGLRNPYRASWDLVDNRFFIGEVGGNVQATAMEDLNLGVAGANYGWPFCEGFCVNPDYTDPLYTYEHVDGGTVNGFTFGGAITAGFVYRGSMFPASYYGTFFLADYVHGWIRYLTFDAAGSVINVTDLTTAANNVVALVEGPEGAVYFVDIFGEVRRITYTSGNQPAQISSTDATPAAGLAPLNVTLSVVATDPESDPLTYYWLFGDGVEASGGSSIAHVYSANGVYTAYVQVSDGTSTTLSNPITIQVGTPPVVQILTPEYGLPFRALDFINFSGTATDSDGALTEASYNWTIRFLHNAHTHPILNDFIGSTGNFQINDAGHDFFDFTGFELILTVTDSDGLSSSDRTEIYPDKVNVIFATVPSGQPIVLDGLPLNTPIAYDTMIDFRHTVSAPVSFCDLATDTGYTFSSWSDGGAQTHEITVPAFDINLIANYQAIGSCINPVVSGLVLQLESDQGLVSNAGIVTSWADQSGMGNDLIAVGDPIVLPGALNGHPVVDFDGVNDKLERTLALTGLAAGNNDRTVYLVANYRGSGFGGFAYGQGACNETFGAIVDDVGNLMAQGWCPANDFPTTVAGTGAGWLIQSLVLENGLLSHYKDGILIDTQSHIFNTVLSKIALGTEIADFQFVDMQAASVMVYNRALSGGEQLQVQNFLQSAYFGSGSGALNQAPVAVNDSAATSVGGAVVVAVLNNDSDADGSLDISTVTVITVPANGTIQNDGAGNLTYTHNGTASTSDTFTYTVADDQGIASNEAIVTLTIGGANQAPIAVDDSAAASNGSSVAIAVLSNDSDDGALNAASVTIITSPANGVLLDDGTGILTYTHNGTATTSDSFIYTVADNLGIASNQATVTLTILAPNQTPIAVNDSAAVDSGGAVVIAVLDNDSDDSALDASTVAITSTPANGALVDDGAGVLTYTHDGTATTSDNFSYTVDDDQGLTSNIAVVAITVNAGTGPGVLDGDVAPLGSPDGVLNAADILVMEKMVLGETIPTAATLQRGDLYPPGAPDGVITLSDLILLRQLILNGVSGSP